MKGVPGMIKSFRIWLAKKILPGKGYMIFYTESPDDYPVDMEINITGPARPGK